MAELGTVVALIKSMSGADPAVIEQAVQDWLDDHPEATTTVQDGSITEAKLAQDVLADLAEVEELKEAIVPLQSLPNSVKDNTETEPITFTNGGYIKNNGSTVDVTDVTAKANTAYAVVSCSPGDIFTVWGTGLDAGRLWCWIKADGTRINRKLSEPDPVFIYAPAQAAKLVLDVITTYDYGAYKGKLLPMAIKESDDAILARISETEQDVLGVEQIAMTSGYYIKTDSSTIDVSSPVANAAYSYAVVSCSPGDQFTVWGRGASYAYLYNFIDDDGTKLLQEQETLTRKIITAPANTTKLVLNRILQYDAGLYKGVVIGYYAGSEWAGKTLATYGDSITWYDGQTYGESHSEAGETCIGYQEYLKPLGMNIVNKGSSGSRMTGVLSTIKASTVTGYDVVTITCGANDFRYPTQEPLGQIAPIGSTFDETTMYGALQSAIEWLITNKPTLKIFLITPIKGWDNGTVMSEDYPDVFREVGKLYSLPVCDWYAESGINAANKGTFIGDDETTLNYSLHPTNAGFKLMGEMLRGFFIAR